MRFFGGKSSKGDKKEPLMHESRAIDKNVSFEDEPRASPPQDAPQAAAGADRADGVAIGATSNIIDEIDIVPTGPSGEIELDANIPARRVTSGEKEMILPKHLRKNLDRDVLRRMEQTDGDAYFPLNEIHTQSLDISESNTGVVSAISLSTIGASIEREVEQAKNMRSAPPLEIKAIKQKTKKKEKFTVKTWFNKTLPNSIIDGLAHTYDVMHGVGKTKTREGKELDDVPITARRYRREHPDLLLPGNVPKVGFSACFAAIPAWVKFSLVGAVAASALIGAAVQLEDTMLGNEFYDWQEENFVDWKEEKTVAFIGNSYMFVNDVPRLMEKISHGRIHQDSCINPSASLGKLLRAGNGMYELWQTENAVTWKYDTSWSGQDEVYDYGSCSVFQLLEGYDNDLTYKNYNGAYYYEEDMNPCFEDEYYIFYHNDKNLKDPMWYDYIVLNDQTRRMADSEARADSVEALKYAYAPMIKQSRAKPLIVDTHAWPSEAGSNETADGETIPYMQAQIYYGVQEYMMALKYNLPSSQAPKVVPVGMAYLVVWDENFDLWSKLFLNDTLPYASPYGSYLFANVLYATVYGHMPRRPVSQSEIKAFFSTARYVPEMPEDWNANDWVNLYPTVEESDYLRLVARRVALNGYIPGAFIDGRNQVEAFLRSTGDDCVCEDEEAEGEEGGASGDEGEGEEEEACTCEDQVAQYYDTSNMQYEYQVNYDNDATYYEYQGGDDEYVDVDEEDYRRH